MTRCIAEQHGVVDHADDHDFRLSHFVFCSPGTKASLYGFLSFGLLARRVTPCDMRFLHWFCDDWAAWLNFFTSYFIVQ